MRKLLKGLRYLESTACVMTALVMLFACGLQVFNRNITQHSIKWTEELARYAMVWMAMLGTSIGLREGKQMSVEALYVRLPGLPRRLLRICGDIICIAFFSVTGYYSIVTVSMQFKLRQMLPGLGWPIAAIYVIVPVAMLAMLVYEIYQLYMDVSGKNETAEKEHVK